MNRMCVLAVSALAIAAGISGCSSQGCCHDGKEVAVAINDLPPAVRATLDRESAGGKVTEVEQELKKGRKVYSADVTLNGQEWDVTIAEDGSLISKKMEKDEKK